MRLPAALVSMQIESLIEIDPNLSIDKLMPEKMLHTITDEVNKGTTDLKKLRSKLPNEIGYPEIRIVAAKLSSGRQP